MEVESTGSGYCAVEEIQIDYFIIVLFFLFLGNMAICRPCLLCAFC